MQASYLYTSAPAALCACSSFSKRTASFAFPRATSRCVLTAGASPFPTLRRASSLKRRDCACASGSMLRVKGLCTHSISSHFQNPRPHRRVMFLRYAVAVASTFARLCTCTLRSFSESRSFVHARSQMRGGAPWKPPTQRLSHIQTFARRSNSPNAAPSGTLRALSPRVLLLHIFQCNNIA